MLNFFIFLAVELGLDGIVVALKDKMFPQRIIVSVRFFILGFIIGIISLYIFPNFIIKNNFLRITNLIISPIILSFIKTLILRRIKNMKGNGISFYIFLNTFLFTLCFLAVRLLCAK